MEFELIVDKTIDLKEKNDEADKRNDTERGRFNFLLQFIRYKITIS